MAAINSVLFLAIISLISPKLVVLPPQPWEEGGWTVILKMDDYMVGIAQPEELDRLKIPYEIIDSDPQLHTYYLVRSERDGLSSYGTVVYSRDGDCILRVYPGAEPKLWESGLPLKRLMPHPVPRTTRRESLRGFSPDTLIREMVAKVDSLRYLDRLRRLQDFRTRFSLTDSCRAAAVYLWSVYDSFGLDPRFQEFREGFAPNVLGTKRGAVEPERSVIVCGHFDAISEDPWRLAPGADDNGSGTCALLEAAQVLKDYDLKRTVKFLSFSGEEQGLLGSQAYVDSVAGEEIVGVINLDMIGYADMTPEDLDLIGNPPSKWLVDSFASCVERYLPELETYRLISSHFQYSDHASFWDAGYSALCGIEDYIVRNPYYHRTGDTIGAGFNSLRFATLATKGMIATLAALAHPMLIPPRPTELLAHAPSPTRVELRWQDNSASEVSFELERKFGEDWVHLASIPKETTHYTDTTVLPGHEYRYRVQAKGRFGASEYSDEAAVTTPTYIAESTPETPSSLTLEIEPNPCRGEVRCRYLLPIGCNPEFTLYDAAGRRVGSFQPGHQSSGRHLLNWPQLKEVLPGVYFLVLRTELEVKVVKLVKLP